MALRSPPLDPSEIQINDPNAEYLVQEAVKQMRVRTEGRGRKIIDTVRQLDPITQGDAIDWLVDACLDIGMTEDAVGTAVEEGKNLWHQDRVGKPKRTSELYSAPVEGVAGEKPTSSWRDNAIKADALMCKKFNPIKYIIPGLIPEGLTIFAGRPKLGKSWMALDIALAISAGRFCLGDKKPAQGDVLYAALEDNQRRLKWRIGKIMGDAPAPERLTLATAWRRLDKGGIQDITEWLDEHPGARLVILDTLAGVKPIRTTQGYTEDYASLETLHRLANDRGVAIIVIHHVRKMDAEDPVDTVSGTLGLTGCADTITVLNRTAKGVTLYLRGRDIQEAEHAVIFNKDTCRWTILGNVTDVTRSKERGNILEALRKATAPMSPSDLEAVTKMPGGNIRKLLSSMTEAEEVLKIGRGSYVHPGRQDLVLASDANPGNNDHRVTLPPDEAHCDLVTGGLGEDVDAPPC